MDKPVHNLRLKRRNEDLRADASGEIIDSNNLVLGDLTHYRSVRDNISSHASLEERGNENIPVITGTDFTRTITPKMPGTRGDLVFQYDYGNIEADATIEGTEFQRTLAQPNQQEIHRTSEILQHFGRNDIFYQENPLTPLRLRQNQTPESQTVIEESLSSQAQVPPTTDLENQPLRDQDHARPLLCYQQDSLFITILSTFSILLPLGVLVGIMLAYRVRATPTLFADPEISKYTDNTHIFVDTRDGTLVYPIQLTLFISPLLGNFIMGLYSSRVAQSLRHASRRNGQNELRPDQFTTIVALCQGSVWGHLKYSYQAMKQRCRCSRKRRPKEVQCATLRRAARMHRFIMLLGAATFLCGSAFTLTISMVNFHKVTTLGQIMYEPGRGLSNYCLEGDRLVSKKPCSSNVTNPNRAQQRREEFRLVHSTSKTSAIHFERQGQFSPQDVAMIIPTLDSVPLKVDFRATAIGVGTECTFITRDCDFHYQSTALDDPAAYLTVFNCSNAFDGVLGKPLFVNPAFSTLAGDPDLCPLCYKPGSSLIFAYFVDPSLNMLYNTLGYNSTSDNPSDEIGVLSDEELVNPFFLAVAGRIPLTGLGVNTTGNLDVFRGQHTYIEFAMRCKVASFDVEYSRVRGIIRNLVSAPTSNGSVLEIYHGVRTYNPTVDPSNDMLEILNQASLQETSEALATKWERLFSAQVLGLIGSTLTPRAPLQQQTRDIILVAMIPLWSLTALALCILAHVGFGLWATLSKRKATPGERLLGDQFSAPGAVWKAFLPWNVFALMDGSHTNQAVGGRTREARVVVLDAEDQSYHLTVR